MPLPGGIGSAEGVRQSFALAPVTGHVELAVAEAEDEDTLPARITTALTAVLAELGGETPSWQQVHRLSVGDRQFLMRQAAAQLGQDGLWLTARCQGCQAPFDFFVEQSRLPVKAAGPGYPYAEVTTADGTWRFRVPNGEDQAAVADMDENEAVRALILRLLVAGDPQQLTDDVLNDAEEALEAIAPEVALAAQAICPECDMANQVALDPYYSLGYGEDRLLDEVHRLATNYHWSEGEILDLPRQRRQRYLARVDRDQGISH